MQFFQWIATNWQTVCAWIGGLYTLYKLGSIVTSVISLFTSMSARFKNAEDTLMLLASNHLPHIQTELQNLNNKQDKAHEVLAEIRDDLRLSLFERKHHDE
jgi:hypothetical protein